MWFMLYSIDFQVWMQICHSFLSFCNFIRQSHDFEVKTKLIFIILQFVQIKHNLILFILNRSPTFQKLFEATCKAIVSQIEQLLYP